MYIEFSPWDESVEVIYPQPFDKISRIFTEKSRHNIEIIDVRHPEKYWDNLLRQAPPKKRDNWRWGAGHNITNTHRETTEKRRYFTANRVTKYRDNWLWVVRQNILIFNSETPDSIEILVRETPESVSRIFTTRRLKKCRKFSLINPIKCPEYSLWNAR
jgi:hypothetical protein